MVGITVAKHDAAVIERLSCDFVQALTTGDGVGFNNLTEEMFRGFCREYAKQIRKQAEEMDGNHLGIHLLRKPG